MFQPFELFQPLFIKRLIKLNKIYIVSQSYKAGISDFEEGKNASILLTDYDDIGLANIHKAAVKTDKYAAVIHLNNPAHLQKLKDMLEPDAEYKIYWSVVKDMADIKKTIGVNNITTFNIERLKEEFRKKCIAKDDQKVAKHIQENRKDLAQLLMADDSRKIIVYTGFNSNTIAVNKYLESNETELDLAIGGMFLDHIKNMEQRGLMVYS